MPYLPLAVLYLKCQIVPPNIIKNIVPNIVIIIIKQFGITLFLRKELNLIFTSM